MGQRRGHGQNSPLHSLSVIMQPEHREPFTQIQRSETYSRNLYKSGLAFRFQQLLFCISFQVTIPQLQFSLSLFSIHIRFNRPGAFAHNLSSEYSVHNALHHHHRCPGRRCCGGSSERASLQHLQPRWCKGWICRLQQPSVHVSEALIVVVHVRLTIADQITHF